jgi:peptidoglycan/LPS O-acetylase OafA/YrhL
VDPDRSSRGQGPQFYVAELDGLRFLAFLAVFIFHASRIQLVPRTSIRWDSLEWWMRSTVLAGTFGVDLFFVLSSFLITSLLVREADVRGHLDAPAFWMRRILRIWPLYFGYLALVALIERLPLRTGLAFALFVGNWPVAGPITERTLVGILWSVQVEEQFYLAWPLVLLVVPRKALRLVCLGMIAASIVWRGVMLLNGGSVGHIWVNTLARLDPIAVGALIALTRGARHRPWPALGRAVVGVGAPLLVIAAAGLLSHELIRPGTELPAPFVIKPGAWPFAATILTFLAVAVGCGGVLLAVLAAPGSWLSHPGLVYLGRISYGLYVFHMASLRVVESWGWPWRMGLGFGITVLAASLSYRFFERPFLRLKERFTHVRSGPHTKRPRTAVVVDPPSQHLTGTA